MYVSMNKKHDRVRVPVTLSLDLEYREQYEKNNGKGKLSELINAVLKEECEKQKNEEAQRCDPLGLSNCAVTGKGAHNEVGIIYRQSTLFEDFAKQDRRSDINKYIESIADKQTLDRIWLNSKVLYNVADTKRKRMAKSLQ